MGGEEGEAEREGGGWEHGQGFGEDVGDSVGLEEVGVELVAWWGWDVSLSLCMRLVFFLKTMTIASRVQIVRNSQHPRTRQVVR